MHGQESRRTQQERRADTETRLLEATSLIAARGSRAVSLAEVGHLAGYSSGIVSHHFGGKQQLLAAVVKYAQHFEVPPAGGSGIDQLAALASAYLASLRDRAPAGLAFLLLWAEAIAGEPALTGLFAERDTWFRALLAGHINDGITDGSVRPDADPQALAVTLLGLLRGTGLQLMSTAAHLPPDSLAAQAVAMILHGIRVPPAACRTADRGAGVPRDPYLVRWPPPPARAAAEEGSAARAARPGRGRGSDGSFATACSRPRSVGSPGRVVSRRR